MATLSLLLNHERILKMTMTNIILAVVAATGMIATAEISTNADYVAGEDSTALLTPALRGAAAQLFGTDAAQQILHAVELNMTKYDIDMSSDSGRRAWHGKLHHEEVSTNDLCKISVYSNETTGVVWRYRQPFKPKPMFVKSFAPRPVMTNGIPARLAAARQRRAIESVTVSNVVITVDANDLRR